MPFEEVSYNPFQEGSKREWKDVPGEAVKNLPGDILDVGKNILEMVKHPVDTYKSIDGLVMGALSKVLPGHQDSEKYIDALTNQLKASYGGMEEIKKTIATEPAKFMLDLSTALSGIGKIGQVAGDAGKLSSLSKVGKVVSTAGESLDPVNMVKGAVKAAIPENLPNSLYQSAAKMPTTMKASDRAATADLALSENIMPTSGGIDKLRGMIDGINTEVSSVIESLDNSGKIISTDALFKHLDELRVDASLSGKPMSNIRAINRVEDEIRKLHVPGRTPGEVQRIKQNIYKDLNTAYGKMSVPYQVEAQKAIARAAKEELEAIHPELKNLNSREGALIELHDAISRSAGRIDNRDLLGIGVPMKGTMGGVAAGPAGVAAGIAAGLLDAPLVKAKLAIALNKAKKATVSKPMTTARQAAYQTSQTSNEEQQ